MGNNYVIQSKIDSFKGFYKGDLYLIKSAANDGNSTKICLKDLEISIAKNNPTWGMAKVKTEANSQYIMMQRIHGTLLSAVFRFDKKTIELIDGVYAVLNDVIFVNTTNEDKKNIIEGVGGDYKQYLIFDKLYKEYSVNRISGKLTQGETIQVIESFIKAFENFSE